MTIHIIEDIAKKIKEIRKLHKLTQEELAAKADVDIVTLRRIEQNIGVPEHGTLIKILAALGKHGDFKIVTAVLDQNDTLITYKKKF